MAVFKREDTVSSHNYISPVFTDLFTEEERIVSHVVQNFRVFFFKSELLFLLEGYVN